MATQKQIRAEHLRKVRKQNCNRGLHEIVVALDGEKKGSCIFCDKEIEIDGQYSAMSTLENPITYRLKSVYSNYSDRMRRYEEKKQSERKTKYKR